MEYADPTRRKTVPKSLASKIRFALTLYPCDCLFVHRDAEREEPVNRRQEILEAVTSLDAEISRPHISIIPIHMTEAWLLFEEAAIRKASGNPNGKIPLNLPRPSAIEAIPDPKELLHDLLVDATELTGRRRKSFDPRIRTHRLAQILDDFSPLRQLSAFQSLEQEVVSFMKEGAAKSRR